MCTVNSFSQPGPKINFFIKHKEIISDIIRKEKATNQKQRLAQYIGTLFSADNITDKQIGKSPGIKMTVIPKMDSSSLQVEVFQKQNDNWVPVLVELISYDSVTGQIVAAGQNKAGECFTGKGYFNKSNQCFMQDVNHKDEPVCISFYFSY